MVNLVCVLRATTKNGRQLFGGKKCTPGKSWLRLWENEERIQHRSDSDNRMYTSLTQTQ